MEIKQKILITVLIVSFITANTYNMEISPKFKRYSLKKIAKSDREYIQNRISSNILNFDPGIETFSLILVAIIWIFYPPQHY